MELKKMTNWKTKGKLQSIIGMVSFLIGIACLASLNAGLILKTKMIPELFFYQLPLIGLVLGIFALFTRNRSRLYAWWGIAVNTFIFIFITLMFILAWTINAKP